MDVKGPGALGGGFEVEGLGFREGFDVSRSADSLGSVEVPYAFQHGGLKFNLGLGCKMYLDLSTPTFFSGPDKFHIGVCTKNLERSRFW